MNYHNVILTILPLSFSPQVTDLDLSVLKGIATSLMAAFGGVSADGEAGTGVGAAATTKTPGPATAVAGVGGMAGGSITYALDKTQRRTVASLRQAFRRADANGDGVLDRDEVETLLRHYLEGQRLDAVEKEAEIEQFIGWVFGRTALGGRRGWEKE